MGDRDTGMLLLGICMLVAALVIAAVAFRIWWTELRRPRQ